MTAIYEFSRVSRLFAGPSEQLEILRDLSFSVASGEALAIVGASGSGKSTLLHLMGALDSPTSGTILFDGKDLAGMSPKERAHFRNRELGFVFQFHHLLPEFSAEENVAMPRLIAGESLAAILPQARELLERVGLTGRMQAKIATLSGGERQRVAIARALLARPRVVLADEPTGNLDAATGTQIEDLLLELNRELGTTLVIVTHNLQLAARMDRCLELAQGALRPLDLAYEKSPPPAMS
ncbi:MAG: ABC transporter ATP-binding protein [Desulfovibrio sp.]|nr:ABC transporter ATP-binding protein [Desulfovibrio sp.]